MKTKINRERRTLDTRPSATERLRDPLKGTSPLGPMGSKHLHKEPKTPNPAPKTFHPTRAEGDAGHGPPAAPLPLPGGTPFKTNLTIDLHALPAIATSIWSRTESLPRRRRRRRRSHRRCVAGRLRDALGFSGLPASVWGLSPESRKRCAHQSERQQRPDAVNTPRDLLSI